MFALLVIAAGAWADQPTPPDTDPLTVVEPPENWIGEEIVVTDLEPMAPLAASAADTCAQASPLQLSFSVTADGSGTLTNLFTEEATDPALTCMFNVPTNPTGYRTAWHVLTAGDTGVVTITTEGTNYDTVLGVFEGTCSALEPLACSDDGAGFQSRVTFSVVRGRTYYIVVADYHAGAPEGAFARLSATMQPGGVRWQQVSTIPVGGLSRHAFAHYGVDMFIIGGQTRITGVPVLSNKTLRYNVVLDQWTELADVPGASLSNTTAARLLSKIYVPGGFNGNTSNYANTHLVYDITTDFWDKAAPIPTALLPGGKMFGWSAAAAGLGETAYYTTGGLASFPPFAASAVVLNNTYRYTPATNQWEAFRPMTTARYAHTAMWVPAADRGLCVAGGLSNGTDGSGNAIIVLLTGGECYNPASGVGWQATGPLNFPRYNAGSALGPDGNWYIFGGIDAQGNGVPEIEVFDPVANSWRLLPGDFAWGGRPSTNPTPEWPRGAFWGENLYVLGGNVPHENRVISAVDRLNIGTGHVPAANRALLPFLTMVGAENLLANALPIGVNATAYGNFREYKQFFDPFYFDWPAFGRVTVRLRRIPGDSNFNIAVYDANKVQRGESNRAQYGGEKVVSLTLLPGRYFIVVERIFPKDPPDARDVYELSVLGG